MATTHRPDTDASARKDSARAPDDGERNPNRRGKRQHPHMPSEVTEDITLFDRFAGGASHLASRAPFFAFCVLLVIVWAPSYFLLGDIDTWQLIINTATTIITFLMVALLQNSQFRTDEATQHKLNAIADGLADLMAFIEDDDPDKSRLRDDLRELRAAVGLEDFESS